MVDGVKIFILLLLYNIIIEKKKLKRLCLLETNVIIYDQKQRDNCLKMAPGMLKIMVRGQRLGL